MADPYHFDTDPGPGPEKIRYGSESSPNFDTDPDSGKHGFSVRKILIINAHIPCFVCLLYPGTKLSLFYK